MVRKSKSPFALVWSLPMVAVLLLTVGLNGAQGDVVDAPDSEYVWTAPVYGSTVSYYVVQVLVNEVDTLDLDPVVARRVSVPMQYGNKYQVRVAGVDADGNQGPYSSWSFAYTPELSPPGF